MCGWGKCNVVLGVRQKKHKISAFLCYNGNVNTKIAISMYCECQSVENEEYTTFLPFCPLFPVTQPPLHQTLICGVILQSR